MGGHDGRSCREVMMGGHDGKLTHGDHGPREEADRVN